MADTSRIEWTDATWNPVTGCTRVSAGCDRCYAETFANRWQGIPGHHYETGFAVTVREERIGLPLHWARPRQVFVTSMGDLFHDQVDDDTIVEVFAVMAAAGWHTFQLLTKRHARLRALLADPGFVDEVWGEVAVLAHEGIDVTRHAGAWGGWPLPNVWVGVSAETQQWADIRLPALAATPAAVRFVSCEPLLGPIDLSRWVGTEFSPDGRWEPAAPDAVRVLDWVIVGGESGAGARPVDQWWIADLVDQAQTGGAAVFVKQLGTAWARAHGHRGKGADPAATAQAATGPATARTRAASTTRAAASRAPAAKPAPSAAGAAPTTATVAGPTRPATPGSADVATPTSEPRSGLCHPMPHPL